MYTNFVKALEVIFKKDFDKKNPFLNLRKLIPKTELIIAEKNQTFIRQDGVINYIYILLQGRALILNQIDWNTDNIVDSVEGIHILGLIESLNDLNKYTAFVMAETECFLLRIPIAVYIEIIQQNIFICYQTLLLLAKVADSHMSRAETNTLFHPKDILGYYLFHQAQNNLPYTYPLTRKKLSEYLHINLRTLYRYITEMRKNNILSLKKGKILIEKEHFQKLAERYANIIL
jgi:cAMP-binding proteins - catabolite gene activator and regulatory subunit of cAMP-dependent protein kinases